MAGTRIHPLSVALLAPLLLVTGCTWFDWLPWIGGDEDDEDKADEPTPLVEFPAEAQIERVWRADIGDGLGRKYLRLNPAVVADRVYAADAYGVVEARNRFDGRRLWRVRVDEPDGRAFYKFWDRRDPAFLTGGVGVGDGRVLVGTTRGEVIALDAADGRVLWRSEVSSEVLARPVADDDIVVVQTGDGRITLLEGDDGALRWSFDTQVPVLTLRGTAAPVLRDGLVYAGFATGKIVAIRAEDGQPVWEQRVMLPEGRSELDRMVDVDSTPLVGRSFIFAVSYQGRIRAFRRSDGAPIWEQDASSFVDLAEGYGQVYVVSDDDVVRAIDQGDAVVVWEQEALRNRRLTSPLAFGNYVLVGDDEGYLHVIAQSDGRFVARRRLDGSGLRSGMIEADGTVYVLSNGGRLEAVEIRRRG
ncbi:MAG: outer membrane protein assembly factor BamB [Gammaproteobacteria bacterium]|nr:outer membrane protein assembly factor BamB [Gammaproteobacteria bacterium]